MKNILEINNITKKYPGVIALSDVSFKIKKGTIHSIVGENGAGKSTLLKIISGVIPHSKYEGEIKFNNQNVYFNNVNDSKNKGIAIIHQELATSPHLSVLENIFLGNLKNIFGFVNWWSMRQEALKYLEMVGLTGIDLSIKVGTLSISKQQLIEIAKALSKNCELLILDEPTASLNDDDAFHLLDLMKKLKKEHNVTSIFVSHKLNEVEYVADSITVIRDGVHISDYDKTKEKITEDRLIRDIVGREMSSKFPAKIKKEISKENLLEIKNYKVESTRVNNLMLVKKANLNIKKGEVVGISGLVGSGRTELALSIFGNQLGKRVDGEILWKNEKVSLKNVSDAIKKGIMYASEDRKHIGLTQGFSINENISMAALSSFSKLGFINKNKEKRNSILMKEKLNIKVPNINTKVNELSGGNQQKVLLAKSLTTDFELLIIDEPTKGIDVGAKYAIYKIIQDLSSIGKSVIVISSEIEELLGITDRIFVMSNGEIKGQIKTEEANSEKIMKMAIGKGDYK